MGLLLLTGAFGAQAYTGKALVNHAKVTMTEARAIALKMHPGKITDEELENEAVGNNHVFANPGHCTGRLDSRYSRSWIYRWRDCIWRNVGSDLGGVLPNKYISHSTFLGGVHPYSAAWRSCWRLPGQTHKQGWLGVEPLLSIGGSSFVNLVVYLYLFA